jgi:antirestriction protein
MLAASPIPDAEEYAIHDYEGFEGARISEYTSLADYGQEMTEDSMTIPPSLQYYIDWQAMARDAEMNGDLFTISTAYNEVHVFAGC